MPSLLPEDLVHSIVEGVKNGDFTVFCGAGISHNSGLPIVLEFEGEVLGKLPVTDEDKAGILSSDRPFEMFMEYLRVVEPAAFQKLLSIYDSGAPNASHRLLAKLMRAGSIRTIVTTNFDRLIERALQDEGFTAGREYRVYYREEGFPTIDWAPGSDPCLIKLHGSVEDMANMAVTLERVAARRFSKARKEVIEQVFSKGAGKRVLILGYSSSDVFDITPQIESIEGPKKEVILIQHSHEQGLESIVEQKVRNPFKNFYGSWRLRYPTDILVKTLYSKTLTGNPYESGGKSTQWRLNVTTWAQSLGEHHKFGLVGSLLQDIPGAAQRRIEALERAFEAARKTSDRSAQAQWMGALGYAHEVRGDFHGAITRYESALKFVRELDDQERTCHWLLSLANACIATYGFEVAFTHYDEALKIARKLDNEKQEAAAISGLGLIYDRWFDTERAAAHFEKALELARDIGDKEREGSSLHDLGSLYYFRQSDLDKALTYYRQAMKVAHELGEKANEGATLGSIGNVYRDKRDYGQAASYYEQALAVLTQALSSEHPLISSTRDDLHRALLKLSGG